MVGGPEPAFDLFMEKISGSIHLCVARISLLHCLWLAKNGEDLRILYLRNLTCQGKCEEGNWCGGLSGYITPEILEDLVTSEMKFARPNHVEVVLDIQRYMLGEKYMETRSTRFI